MSYMMGPGGQRDRNGVLGPGGKLSRVPKSSTMNGTGEILLNALHASLGSLSLSIIVSGSCHVLLPRFFMLYLYVSKGDFGRIVLCSSDSLG
jgi:hypothetical protein